MYDEHSNSDYIQNFLVFQKPGKAMLWIAIEYELWIQFLLVGHHQSSISPTSCLSKVA